jgi:hypothetical protein
MPFLNPDPKKFYIFEKFECNKTESRADQDEKVNIE